MAGEGAAEMTAPGMEGPAADPESMYVVVKFPFGGYELRSVYS